MIYIHPIIEKKKRTFGTANRKIPHALNIREGLFQKMNVSTSTLSCYEQHSYNDILRPDSGHDYLLERPCHPREAHILFIQDF